MAKIKKWEIKRLNRKLTFGKSSKYVLKNRLRSVIKHIHKYNADVSKENLHALRIALRRLRYNMEIYFSCFNKDKFLVFYDNIVQLQDKTGEVRDLDVLYENIFQFNQNMELNLLNGIDNTILDKKEKLKTELEKFLLEFLDSDILKDFNELLS